MDAVVYIAHGSRKLTANDDFIAFINKVMPQSGAAIQAFGFLEHASPSAEEAIEACVKQGAGEITIVPVFLLPGVHVNQDLPALYRQYPQIRFRTEKPIGVGEGMVEILMDRLFAAGFNYQEESSILLVGHGSREQSAGVQFEKLARALELEINKPVHPAYLTTPVYYQEMAKELNSNKVYILPYLLFCGVYTVKMKTEIEKLNGNYILCEPIGFGDKLIRVLTPASEIH